MFVLTIPWILIALLFISVILLLLRKWIAGLLLLVICIGLNCYFECIPFRLGPISEQPVSCPLKVMSFNIDGAETNITERAERIVEIINKNNPDIVFLAEFYEDDLNVLDTLLSKTFSYSTCTGGYFHYFYSKYPLGVMTKRECGGNGSGAFRCRVAYEKDSITFYGCHFASNNYTIDKRYITPDSIGCFEDAKTYINDIGLAYSQRAYEANLIANDISSDFPIIVMGDFNDVGGSKAIRVLENAGLKDAWWNGGFGYGATIHKPLPYRIDHILFSEKMKLNKIEIVSSEGLSDHDALYAEFSL